MQIRDALAKRASSYAAILVDVDDLKRINDNHGHAVGDECLMGVAEAMRTSVRKTDICARLGGDEFLIFASACDLNAATDIARGILTKLHARSGAASHRSFGVSIGIVVASAEDADFEAMYRCADQALYKAKAGGRNCYIIFDAAAA